MSDAFVGLADTLGGDFDVVDLCHRLAGHCVHLGGADAAWVMLADGRGGLRLMGSSAEDAALLDLVRPYVGHGPCLDCYSSGAALHVDLAGSGAARWPGMTGAARAAGFRILHAVPLRLRERTIGAVGLFFSLAEDATDDNLHLVQAMADVAALTVLHWPTEPRPVSEILTQLQHALTIKSTVEQAKGLLAAAGDRTIEQAAAGLRAYARREGLPISTVATRLIRRTLAPQPVLDAEVS